MGSGCPSLDKTPALGLLASCWLGGEGPLGEWPRSWTPTPYLLVPWYQGVGGVGPSASYLAT